MTWSCIAVKTPSVSANKPVFVSHFSTLLCLRIVGWGHTDGGHARLFGTIVSWLCYYILHLWQVHLHSCGLSPVVCTYRVLLLLQHEETTWPVFFKKYVWRSFTCLSCSWVIWVNPLPPICRGRVSLSFAARRWWNLYLVSNIVILVWRFSKSVGVHFTVLKLKVLGSHKYW